MNARVFLLVLVTGLFMVAWNGDQAAMQAALASRERARSALASVQPDVDAHTPRLTSAVAKPSEPAPPIQDSRGNQAAADLVPLPPGIAAGTYQAVSDRGIVQTITVSPRQATGSTSRDLFITDADDGSRWYLVRQQAPSRR